MIRNGICLGVANKQSALFSEKCAPKNAPMPSLSRIGPALYSDKVLMTPLVFSCHLNSHQTWGKAIRATLV